jgi:hypothetical protein
MLQSFHMQNVQDLAGLCCNREVCACFFPSAHRLSTVQTSLDLSSIIYCKCKPIALVCENVVVNTHAFDDLYEVLDGHQYAPDHHVSTVVSTVVIVSLDRATRRKLITSFFRQRERLILL